MSTLRMTRPPLPAIVLLFFVCMGLTFVSLPGCNQNQRADTLHGALVTVVAVHDGYASWDLDQQKAIAKDVVASSTTRAEAEAKGTAARTAYLAKRSTYDKWFEVAFQAIATAATQTDDLSLSKAIDQLKILVDDIQKLTGKSFAIQGSK